MKSIKWIIYFLIAALCANCGERIRTEKQLTREIEIIGVDSIELAKSHSIMKIEAEKETLTNRRWEIRTFVNEYGEKTEEKYIETKTDGTFSNSATSNSYLRTEIILTKKAAGIFLHEYKESSAPVKFIGSSRVKMKNNNNEEIEIFSGRSWNQTGGILIDNNNHTQGNESDYSKFLRFLKKSNGEIKFVIYDKYSSVYRFSVDMGGFEEEFSKL